MLISVIGVHIGRGIPMNLGEKQDLVDELRRQIELCARQVDAYSNKRDKNAKNMWYYWYGRREECEQILAYIQNKMEQPALK